MSQDQVKYSLPFVTRDMLSFEHGTQFQIQINTQAMDAKVLQIRGMTREGVFTFKHTTQNTGVIKSETFSIPDIPIFLSVIDVSNSFQQGGCYATVDLNVNGDRLYEICSGQVFSLKTLSWPQSTAESQRLGGGQLREIAGANPAAGSEFTITVPTGRIWRIVAVNFTLVTAAVAVSRRVHLVFNFPDSGALNSFSDVDQITNETKFYTAAAFGDLPDRTDDNDILIPIPPNIMIREGGTIVSQTTNKDAGDDFSSATAVVEEFFNTAL